MAGSHSCRLVFLITVNVPWNIHDTPTKKEENEKGPVDSPLTSIYTMRRSSGTKDSEIKLYGSVPSI